MTKRARYGSILLNILLFAIVVASAYFARYHHFRNEEKKNPDFLPFTRESAMMYSYSLRVARGEGIPKFDEELAGLEKVPVASQMSIGLEYFLGYGYRLKNLFFGVAESPGSPFEDSPDFTRWARIQMRAWISLSAGLIFLWLIFARVKPLHALLFAMIYAFAPAAISRATGQDLIRELFAIPFIISFFTFSRAWLGKGRAVWIVLALISEFLALATWDMTQLCFAIWGLYEIIRLFRIGSMSRRRKTFVYLSYATAILAAFLVPYLRAHSFYASPLMAVIFPLLVVLPLLSSRRDNAVKRMLVFSLSALFFIVAWRFALSVFSYGANYSHFLSLLIAKIKFMNVKPALPSLLDFDSRILWTPALHSATMRIFRFLFPAMPYLLAILLCIRFFSRKRKFSRFTPSLGLPLFCSIFFFLLFIFMVRFHVLAIIFICVACALLSEDILRSATKRFAKAVLYTLVLLALLSELDISLRLVEGGGRSYEGEYIGETSDLIRWMRSADLKGKTVLTAFTISPMLKAYCGTNIVLQPKFELPATRDMVEEYLKIIYKGNEQDLSKFCEKYGVDFYVFDKGYNGAMHPDSSRYCADAENFTREAPVFRFYHKRERDKLRGFYEIEPPKELPSLSHKYLLFKVISKKDYADSLKLVSEARLALKNHDIMKACELAEKAVYLDPFSYKARILHVEIFGRPAMIKLERYKELGI